MLKKEMVEIPAREQERVTSVTCDLCKREFSGATTTLGHNPGIEWLETDGPGRMCETQVRIAAGTNDVDAGGERQTRAYHVCPICFVEKLEPWLREQGATPTTDEYVF